MLLACAAGVDRLAAAVTVAAIAGTFESPVYFTRLHGVPSRNTVMCKINIVKTSQFANLFTHCVLIVNNSDCRKRDGFMVSELCK